MKKQLLCGAASRIINPWSELTVLFPGYSDTILDDIRVRVICLSDTEEKYFIMSFGTAVPNAKDLCREIENKLHISSDHTTFFAVPNHSVIPCMDEALNIPNPRKQFHKVTEWPKERQDGMHAYSDFIIEKAIEAAKEAEASLRPARMGHATGESYVNVSRNQRFSLEQPDGSVREHYATGVEPRKEVDHSLFLMKFVDAATQEPIAFLINYAMLGMVTISNNLGKDGKMAITGDVPGKCCDYMEEKYPGSVALWSCGAAGNANPVMSLQMSYPDPETGRPQRLFAKDPEVGLIMLKLLSTRLFADIMETLRSINHYSENTKLGCEIEWSETPGYDENNKIVEGLYKVRMQGLRVGDVLLLGVSGNMYSSIAEQLVEASPFRYTRFITVHGGNLANSEYLLDDWVFEHSVPVEERMKMGPRDMPHDNNDPKAERVMKFDGKIDDCIVGTEHSQIVPGTLVPSLKIHTTSISEKLL